MTGYARIWTVFSLMAMGGNSYAQDLHFSQTTRSTFQTNPALTGVYYGDLQATVNWKDQWQSVNNTFRTMAAQIEYSFGKGNLKRPTHFAVGGHFYKDASGDVEMGNTLGGLSLSTLVPLSRTTRIILGVQGTYGQTGINMSKTQWGNQYNGLAYDASLPSGETISYAPFNYFDMAAGLAVWFRKTDQNVTATAPTDIKLGFAMYHLNRPKYSHSETDGTKMPFRYLGHVSAILGTRWHNIHWYPNLMVAVQGQQHEVLFGSLWRYRFQSGSKSTGFVSEVSTSWGVDARITNVIDALVPHVYLNLGGFSIGASYDVNISRFWNASKFRGGFELSLRFTKPDAHSHRNPFRNGVVI
jgi:type IX secretion system PorP/SprF family membrane protein